ncbi:unnamed protein product [Ilex paraguariensis]|uniref:CSC1/OSCA1-like 7TM region domain-containing protein n=1 Tax=Ilex paraguariensis TaxID=185542 RepID=A0ABC8QMK8_9AQUA
MIPIAFVQSLANLEGLEKVAPFLKPVIELKFIKSFLQGFLPSLALKIFLYILPTVLLILSKVEGYVALSVLERRAAAKCYYFMLVNVFLGSIMAGTSLRNVYRKLESDLQSSKKRLVELVQEFDGLKKGREESEALDDLKAIEQKYNELKGKMGQYADNDSAAFEAMS